MIRGFRGDVNDNRVVREDYYRLGKVRKQFPAGLRRLLCLVVNMVR